MNVRLGLIYLVLVFAASSRITAQTTPELSTEKPVLNQEVHQKGADDPGVAKIAAWVSALDSPKFVERRDATDYLIASQSHCVQSLEAALAKRCSIEVEMRALGILGRIAIAEANSKNEALMALRRLRDGPLDGLSRRARVALTPVLDYYKDRAFKLLVTKGARPDSFRGIVNFPGQNPAALKAYSSRITFDDSWKGSDEDLEALEDLYDLSEITLVGENMTDAFLKPLKNATSLRAVSILKTKITDEGFKSLENLPVERLTIRYSPISDKSIPTIRTMKKLQGLQTFGTDIKTSKSDLIAELHDGIEIDHRRGGFLGVGPSGGLVNNLVGCAIGDPQPNSAAQKADLRANDIVIKYNGKGVTDFDSLRDLIMENKVGDEVAIEVLRGKAKLTKKVTLGEWSLIP